MRLANPPKRFWSAIAALVIFLIAPADAQQTISFADSRTIPVDAVTLEVRIPDPPPREYPYVGYLAPTPYSDVVHAWAAQRFALTGGSVNTLRITMRQGAITEKLLPVTTGVAGWFKKEQGAEYQGSLEIEVAIIDPNGQLLASADGRSWANETVAKNATQADREATWERLILRTFDNLDKDLIPRVYEAMRSYVR
jgi:hypothetical protein